MGASNSEPTFSSSMVTRTVPENSSTGTNVGSVVTASDSDNDTLTYGLKTTNDHASFTIVSTSGQIQAKTGITYNFEGSKNSYTVIVTVRDSKDAAGGTDATVDDEIEVTINLTNVNEAPTIAGSTTRSIPENSTAVATYTATDPDASTTYTWSVESADDGGKFDITSAGGVLSFRSAPDFETPTDVGMNNTYVVTVKVTDNGSPIMSDTHQITVTVTNVNEAPEITTVSTTYTAFNVDENTATSVVIKTYEATDEDANSVLTWSLEGNDAGDFTITKNAQGRGELTFKAPPNYESPIDSDTNNTYSLTVKVRDNHSGQLSDTVSVVVTVNDVNETPVVSGSNSPDFPEIEFDVDRADLTTANLTVPGTYTFYDDDGDDVSWSLSGVDSNHFTITEDASGNGVLTFKNPSPGTNLKPADFENPVDTGSGNDVRDRRAGER